MDKKKIKISKQEIISSLVGISLISIILASGAMALLISFLYYTIYEFDFPTLPTINLPKNVWFESSNNNIYSQQYNNAIEYNKLTLSLNFTNQNDYAIKIIPELEYFSDEREIIRLTNNEIEIQSNSFANSNMSFFVNKAGTNHLNVTAAVFFINGTLADKIVAQSDLQVVTMSSKLQHDSNAITLKATIVSTIIGGITITALAITLYFSNKQTKFMINNSIEEQRPWLSVSDSDKPFEITNDTVSIDLKNYGKTQAIITTAKGFVREKLFTIDELKNAPSLYDIVDDSTAHMAPTELWTEPIPIDEKMQNKIKNNDFYFGLYMEYEYHNKTYKTELIINKEISGFTFIRKRLT